MIQDYIVIKRMRTKYDINKVLIDEIEKIN
jgi:hypothetical protein